MEDHKIEVKFGVNVFDLTEILSICSRTLCDAFRRLFCTNWFGISLNLRMPALYA